MQHPDVHYAYSNQIQMDADMGFDLVSRHFAHDSYFAPGAPSFRNTWLKSILITGIALRRSEELYQSYPESTMLFPQVELIGRLLSKHGSYAIADFLVAARAHADQLGFHANRGQRIVGPERHGTMEILDIAERLDSSGGEAANVDDTAQALARALATNLPNEKLRGSTRIAVSNAMRLMRRSSAARRSALPVSMLVTASLPPATLDLVRRTTKGVIRRRQRREAASFTAEVDRQTRLSAEAWQKISADTAATSRLAPRSTGNKPA